MRGADAPDEFETIARLFRPLAAGAPEALNLADDAAVLPARPGFDLVVSKDAIVEGVHFLPDDPPDLVARKLLRANLSDLAAKGAEPYGYFLAVAWPARFAWADRDAFARGLAEDQGRYALKLFGGDTVSTPGPLTASATILGWVPAGGTIRRAGAAPGDLVLVSGTIGDGWLGLAAARGEGAFSEADRAYLAGRYRLPNPRLDLRESLRVQATAAADVSDGLAADVGHIAMASGVGVDLDLDRLPLSDAAAAWLNRQTDRPAALARLASGGDDYEVVFTAREPVPGATVVGRVRDGAGVSIRHEGRPVAMDHAGWRHGEGS